MAGLKRINPPGTEAVYERFKLSHAVVANGRVEVAGQVASLVLPALKLEIQVSAVLKE